MDVKGHAAIVTGAATGMGAATAAALSDAGAKVALFDVKADVLRQTAEQVGGLAVVNDVSSAEDTEAGFAAAREAHGPARILVNCAGIGQMEPVLGPDGSIMSLESFNKVDLPQRSGPTPIREFDAGHDIPL